MADLAVPISETRHSSLGEPGLSSPNSGWHLRDGQYGDSRDVLGGTEAGKFS